MPKFQSHVHKVLSIRNKKWTIVSSNSFYIRILKFLTCFHVLLLCLVCFFHGNKNLIQHLRTKLFNHFFSSIKSLRATAAVISDYFILFFFSYELEQSLCFSVLRPFSSADFRSKFSNSPSFPSVYQ